MKVPTVNIDVAQIDLVEEARFWAMVDIDWRPGACWAWRGESTAGAGYGRFKWRNRRVSANRFAFALANGRTPEGRFVCHHCDNPACVRPDHLFLGDAVSNAKDKVEKGRHAHGSRAGTAILDEEQVALIKAIPTSVPAASIGAAFGVRKSTIQKIRSGVNWAHVSVPSVAA